jgi:undecaprenyl-diphosphatase
VTQLDSAPPTSSFPSGHVFATLVLWGSIAIVAYRSQWRSWIRSTFTVLAFILPVIVALSRVYRGMHHLTDVIASIALGVLWLFALVRIFPPRHAAPTETSTTATAH